MYKEYLTMNQIVCNTMNCDISAIRVLHFEFKSGSGIILYIYIYMSESSRWVRYLLYSYVHITQIDDETKLGEKVVLMP